MNTLAKVLVWIYVQISKMPLDKLYLLGDILYYIMICLPMTKGIRQRIAQGFPKKDRAWHRQIEKKFCRSITDFFAEFIKYLTWSEKEIVARMQYENLNLLKQLLDKHRYVVCYSGHFVNYELFAGLPLHIHDYGMCNFYDDSVRNYPYLNRWLKSIRERWGAISVPVSSPLRDIMKMHTDIKSGHSNLKGFVIGSLLDTRASAFYHPKAMIMGQELPLHYGTERIGRRIGAAFVYAHISRSCRGHYKVLLKELQPNSDGSYMDAYIKAIEENIMEQPELWMMWGNI